MMKQGVHLEDAFAANNGEGNIDRKSQFLGLINKANNLNQESDTHRTSQTKPIDIDGIPS
jgi:hypothetical protein